MRVAVSLVDRCVEVVDLLAHDAGGMALGEISAHLDEPKSAMHRLLNALCARGWVEQDPQTGFYRLTLRLAVLGQRFLMSTGVLDLCHPVLEGLARQSRELVRLAVADGDSLFWTDSVQGSPTGLVYQPNDERKVALHATAAGKAWLATLPVDQAVRIVLESGFGERDQFGPKSVRSVEALIEALEETRKRGWATAIDEAEGGIASIAAAIKLEQSNGPAVGVVGIDAPVARASDVRLAELSEMVVVSAAELSDLWAFRTLPSPELRLAS